MKAKEIADVIGRFAPLSTQEAWDNSGFCIGSPEQEIHGVMIGLDCTPALIREAADKGADMVVTHHPLIFSGVKRIDPSTFQGEAIAEALRRGMVIYSAHTNADKAMGGVTALMARRLSLSGVEPIVESNLAQMGTLPEPLSGEEFIKLVKRAFSLDVVRSSDPAGITVSKVALCSGSGSEFIPDAIRAGADAFVTGEISYHKFFCEKGFMVLDIGHYESEVEIGEAIFSLLRKNFPTFALYLSNEKLNNPIHYF